MGGLPLSIDKRLDSDGMDIPAFILFTLTLNFHFPIVLPYRSIPLLASFPLIFLIPIDNKEEKNETKL